MSSLAWSEAEGGAEVHAGAANLVVALLGEDLDTLSGRELAARLGDVERLIRRLEAVAVAAIGSADRRAVFAEDGHASVRGWVKASIRASDVEVTQRVRSAELVASQPSCLDALASGQLGVAQVRELARVQANPRCASHLSGAVGALTSIATSHTFEVFRRAVRQWERLTDADGTHRDHEAAHAGRSGRAAAVGDTVYLDARFGAAQGTVIMEVLDRFARAEYAAEWEDLRARHGDDACPELLERTERQRRADALVAIFEAAATALPGAARSEPLVSIIIDQAVYEAQLAAMVNDGASAPPHSPADLDHGHCQTVGGLPVDPADAVAASLVGRVRRVIFDADGVIIDLGCRSRLFTGSARDAALLQAALDGDRRCLGPGCGLHHCQVDHAEPWGADGRTAVENAGPLCPRHNRFKSRGYRTRRDPTGRWHVYRPDGTEIVAT